MELLSRVNPFLKGTCEGVLLTIIGRDDNNQVYPIAWAIVVIESKGNWKWFVEIVNMDLGLQGGSGMGIISDQHKICFWLKAYERDLDPI